MMLETRDLTKVFQVGDVSVRAVDGVSLTVADGESVAIMGPSGSGKTTLISCLGCLTRPTSGEIIVNGGGPIDYKKKSHLARIRQHEMGFIFQSFNLIPFLSALENVIIPLQNAGVKGKTARGRAQELLDSVGLLERQNHLPSQLSGGEQQRVSIARALAGDPRIILADEPTANLDTGRGKEIMAILETLCRKHGKTLICVTHDQRMVEHVDRVLNMVDGRLVGDVPVHDSGLR
ncbi:MAG: ABC transporter ATP-binding protein [Anaerolineae bacterium]